MAKQVGSALLLTSYLRAPKSYYRIVINEQFWVCNATRIIRLDSKPNVSMSIIQFFSRSVQVITLTVRKVNKLNNEKNVINYLNFIINLKYIDLTFIFEFLKVDFLLWYTNISCFEYKHFVLWVQTFRVMSPNISCYKFKHFVLGP